MFYKLGMLILFTGFILTSCKVGPDFHRPLTPATPYYTQFPTPLRTAKAKSPGGQAQHLMIGEDIPAEWWHLFHSPAINELVCRGIAKNPSYQAALASLDQAVENYRAEVGSSLFPLITANYSAARMRASTASFGNFTPAQTFNLYNLQANLAYNLDIFGGLRRNVEAFGALADYQYFQMEGAFLTLTASIVTTAIAEASLQAQIEATQELIELLQQQLVIIEKQLRLGGASLADVLTQETLLTQTQANLPPLQKNLLQTRNALAVLTGSVPSESCLPSLNLNSIKLPTHLPLSVPAALVSQRPDVRAAEELLHQATANIGVATSNILPQFSLTGYIGWQGNLWKELFNDQFFIWNFTRQVTQTLFDGGSLLARRRATIAAFDYAFDQYKLTVLKAFQNVADTLEAIHMDSLNLQVQANAEQVARRTLNLTQKQYRLGAVSYLFVLNAQQQYQQARIRRVIAQAARYTDTANLFQALGGGWWNR